MLLIGSHVNYNSKEQLLGATKDAISFGSTTFMFYTGAPQNTVRSNIDDTLTEKAKVLMKENNIDIEKVIVHAPYAVDFLKKELKRVDKLGIKYMVLHPGSHVGLGREVGLNNIVTGLNEVLKDSNVTILLETMAGKGTELGTSIDEIKYLIDNTKYKDKIGICLDTCHLNDSGYDMNKFDELLDEFDKKIGLDYIKCIHINDSKNPISSHKDRHENIGYGTIGFDTLINIIYNKRLEDIPKILETPYIEKNPPYKEEIENIKLKEFKNKVK